MIYLLNGARWSVVPEQSEITDPMREFSRENLAMFF
jgi:hypothetical protein